MDWANAFPPIAIFLLPLVTLSDSLVNRPPNLLTILSEFLNPLPTPFAPCAIELLIRLNRPPRLGVALSDCPRADLAPAPAEPVAIDD